MVKRTVRSARHAGVSTPDDLDALLELLIVETPADVGVHEGEHLFATERVLVTPQAGVFTPAASLEAGHELRAGEVVGTVADTEIRSPFAGTVVGVLAVAGERVTATQPLAWMRTT
jgi:[acyl-carrier-protein] S-malonyltransferase